MIGFLIAGGVVIALAVLIYIVMCVAGQAVEDHSND
jgi:fructose-specific phosphotransferase system IIC component